MDRLVAHAPAPKTDLVQPAYQEPRSHGRRDPETGLQDSGRGPDGVFDLPAAPQPLPMVGALFGSEREGPPLQDGSKPGPKGGRASGTGPGTGVGMIGKDGLSQGHDALNSTDGLGFSGAPGSGRRCQCHGI